MTPVSRIGTTASSCAARREADHEDYSAVCTIQQHLEGQVKEVV